jgi:hypothetical protein
MALNASMVRRALRRLLGPKLALPNALHVCTRCGDDSVRPTRWSEEAPELSRVRLRCGACGHERETVMGDHFARLFKRALEEREQALAARAEADERERMARWAEAFAAALERDAVTPADF